MTVSERRSGLVTPLGWTALGAAVGLFLLAFWGGWTEFAIAGTALLATLPTALVFAIGRSSYRVEIDLRTRRVVVGEPASGRILVSSTAARPMRASRLELPIGDGVGRLTIPPLKPGAPARGPVRGADPSPGGDRGRSGPLGAR